MALQYVADSNLQTVTLGSNYTLGDTSMVLTTGQGARLPSSGDFWIMTPDTAPPNRIIWKVTARSSDTLTVVYDNSYGADANLTTGTRLMWSLTAEALTQLKTDIAGNYGTFANLPAATAGVVRYDFTDSPYSHAISDGSAWHYFYPGAGEIQLPPVSSLTWVNQGSATSSSTQGPLSIAIPGSGTDNLRVMEMNYPTPPFTVKALVQTFGYNVDYMWGGSISIRDSGTSSTAKLLTFGTSYQTMLFFCRTNWTNQTTYSTSAPVGGGVFRVFSGSMPIWHKLEDDNTNFTYSISYNNGASWIQIISESRTAFLGTPTKLGFGANSRNSQPVYATLLSWQVS